MRQSALKEICAIYYGDPIQKFKSVRWLSHRKEAIYQSPLSLIGSLEREASDPSALDLVIE